MDEGSGNGEVWARLIREIIASWRLLLGAMLLLLSCAPTVAAVALVVLVLRWS